MSAAGMETTPAAATRPAAKPIPSLILAFVAFDVFLMDQLSKYLILRRFALNTSTKLLPFFSLTVLRNTGAAFGMFMDSNRGFIVLTSVILFVLAFLHRRIASEGRLTSVALALLWGGAAGNLADRVRFGAVTDFLDFFWGAHHWPAFNLADSAITVGVALMFLENLLNARRR